MAIEEFVEGKSTIPATKLTPNYFSSNENSPSIRSNLADKQAQIDGQLMV